MLRRLSACAFVLFLAACGGIKFPQPPPPPPPESPSPVCQPGHGDPGEYYGCWTLPPGQGWTYVCPWYDESGVIAGTTEVGDPALCPAEPVKPEPPSGPNAGLIPDEELTPTDAVGTGAWPALNAAIHSWRDKHPEAWRADGACLIDGPAGIDAAFAGIAAELAPLPAGQSIDKDGKRSDCIWVNLEGTDLYAEAHIFDYRRGCVSTISNSIKGVYRRSGTGTVEPPEPPSPPDAVDGCAPPLPPHITTVRVKRHEGQGYNLDSTGKVKDANYCREVAEAAGEPPQGTCPVRPECGPDGFLDDGTECYWKDRVACEAYATEGVYEWLSDGPIEVKPDNPWRARYGSASTWVQLCVGKGEHRACSNKLKNLH